MPFAAAQERRQRPSASTSSESWPRPSTSSTRPRVPGRDGSGRAPHASGRDPRDAGRAPSSGGRAREPRLLPVLAGTVGRGARLLPAGARRLRRDRRRGERGSAPGERGRAADQPTGVCGGARRPSILAAAQTHRAVGFTDGALFDEIQLGRLLLGEGDLPGATSVLESVLTRLASLSLFGTALEAAIRLAECLVAGWTRARGAGAPRRRRAGRGIGCRAVRRIRRARSLRGPDSPRGCRGSAAAPRGRDRRGAEHGAHVRAGVAPGPRRRARGAARGAGDPCRR